MPTLPAHPHLEHLRRQAKDLLRAADAGDRDALDRIRAVSDRLTLAAAQLAVARSYGFASWPKLKAEVDARTLDLDEKATAFCEASISDGTGRAARMLAAAPETATYSFATAVVLGDADRVRADLRRDSGLATRREPRSGWTPLHVACASRWHQFEPARAEGLLTVAELLLAAGAEPTAETAPPHARASQSPLRCAIASANSGPSNLSVVELLLRRGAVPDDHDLYLAGFAHDRHRLLPILLAHLPSRDSIEQALATPISTDDADAARLLLEAGADPNRYRNDDGDSTPIVWAAVEARCSVELLELLLTHHADPNLAGPDRRTPYRLATAAARTDLVELLSRYGARDDATAVDAFLSACLRADRAEARRRLDDAPGLLARLSDNDLAALVHAAETGKSDAVALMLDLGFPVETRGDNGDTALHAAAYSGSADTVRVLLERGADIESRDTTWNSTSLEWAAVGSGERPRHNASADWVETVRTLIESGASTDDVTLSPDDPKPPSRDVAELLRATTDRTTPS